MEIIKYISIYFTLIITSLLINKKLNIRGFKVKWYFVVSLAFVTSSIVLIRYNLALKSIIGIALILNLIYASICDVNSHEVDDYIHIIILALAIPSIYENGYKNTLIGFGIMLLIWIFLVMFLKNSLGGADMKLSLAMTFMLGLTKEIAALFIGLSLGVIVSEIYFKIKKIDKNTKIALIPYLSIGAFLMYII